MSLSRHDVEKVARLARLRLSEAELEVLTVQLGQIVGYVEQLGELNTDSVAPLAHPLELVNVFREDEPVPSFPRQTMLANSPQHDGTCYRVPPVLGE